ncbi:MAG: aconitase X catalytic domain-containing protein [Desulfobacterales bacterium]|nr:MAG: aconitase X catalytic domain-containing protein [Desulfobacterales bacterium]
MQLTDQEMCILDGKEGDIKALAMSYLVKLGNAFDGQEMVDIAYAHMSSGSALREGEIDYLAELADQDARVVVPTSSEVIPVDLRDPDAVGAPWPLVAEHRRLLGIQKRMGIASTYTCVPFTQGYVPAKGTYIASMETAAIIYFNSVLGAKTNRCGYFVLYAALTGKYPKIGYLLDENRKGSHLVAIDTELDGTTDYGAAGYYVGSIVGSGVPVFEGIYQPRQEELMVLGSALATSGTVAMYHITGVTPDAPTTEGAFGGNPIQEKIVVTKKELDEVYQKLHTAKNFDVDFVYLGCPQYTVDQIRNVAALLDGRRVHTNTTLWIGTNRMAFAMAERMGYHEIIKKAGGVLVCDTCPMLSFLRLDALEKQGLSGPAYRTMLTDSPKQAKYANNTIGCDIILDKIDVCIESAVIGKWRG